jgi:hypothetical protein
MKKLTALAALAAPAVIAVIVGCSNPSGGGGNVGSAQAPVISTQPQGAVYGKDATPTPLTVTASVGDGGTLSYQWYKNTEDANTGGTSVGTNAASYTPPTDTVETCYYYVVVTNTLGDVAASTISDTAEIEVNNLVNAQLPVISAHPQEAVYLKDTTAAVLGVTASAGDGGTLSYQWYKNTEDANTGGTSVGTNAASYTPPTDTVGTWYYYVTVTNTIGDNSDGGEKTQSLSSNPAKITVTTGLPDLAAIGIYLAAVSGGDSAADLVPLPVGMELSAANWSGILEAIAAVGKYVDLDLSACTMGSHNSGGGLYGDGTFDPDYTISTGKTKIVSLSLPDAAVSVKENFSSAGTFWSFTNLTDLTGANVKTIGVYAFRSCTALETVILPAAQSIEMEAFFHCTALKTITIPEVKTISVSAFSGCTALTTVNLPASLTTIWYNPFLGCTKLTGITVDAGNPNYKHSDDNRMILNKAGTTLIAYPSADGAVTLSGITAIGNFAFYGCTALETVSLPAATTIGDRVFESCTALETVNLPNAVTIGFLAFSHCTSLTSVDLPAATSIGQNAFSRGTGTTASLTVTLGPAIPTLGINMFEVVTGTKSVTVKVPSGADAWTGKTGSFTDAENTTGGPYWGEGFRGKGWTGDGAYVDGGTVNENISLTIEVQAE